MITRKGRATRDRIVTTAAALVYAHGIAGTSTEDVQSAAGVSASQLYHYFRDKRGLISAVIQYQTTATLGFQQTQLARLDDLDALRAWVDAIVGFQRANGFRGGCPLGSLASEVVEGDVAAREDIARAFRQWQGAIRDGLSSMKDRGKLAADADVDALATALLTTLQGGLLLAKTLRDGGPLETSLNAVIDHIASFAS